MCFGSFKTRPPSFGLFFQTPWSDAETVGRGALGLVVALESPGVGTAGKQAAWL